MKNVQTWGNRRITEQTERWKENNLLQNYYWILTMTCFKQAVCYMNLSGYQGIYRYIYVYKLKYLNIDQNICGITTMPAVQTNANWTKWPVCCFTLTIESNNYAGNYPFPAFCLASVTKHIIVKIFGYGLRFKNLFQNNCLNIQQMLPTAT